MYDCLPRSPARHCFHGVLLLLERITDKSQSVKCGPLADYFLEMNEVKLLLQGKAGSVLSQCLDSCFQATLKFWKTCLLHYELDRSPIPHLKTFSDNILADINNFYIYNKTYQNFIDLDNAGESILPKCPILTLCTR